MINYLMLLFLLVGLILWSLYKRGTAKVGAPYVPTKPEFVERVMELAKVKQGDVFFDLGSGDGRLVIAAALRGAQAYGVEIDSLRYWYSRLWIKLLRLNQTAKIVRKNFFGVDLSGADVVCLFLLQDTNEKLEKKLEKELKPGTRVVSIAFRFPHWQPVKIDPLETAYGPIYLYIR